MAQHYEVTARADGRGERLDRLLAAELPDLSRSRIKQLIEAGQVTLAGEPLRQPAARVRPGQTYAVVVPDAAPAEPRGQAMALDILYEDDQVIVLNKPAGLVVHPAPGNPDRTLVNALIAHCGDSLTGIGGVQRPGIVHRLDKDTSGVMIAAKCQSAHADLVAQFAERRIERCYQALVWGVPAPAAGEITGNIGRSPRNRKKMAVLATGGRPAATRYKLLRAYGGGLASLIECRLMSGRTHQIRVHLTHRGHGLLGDPVYGRAPRAASLPAALREALNNFSRQALHARTLGFRHPGNGEFMRFETPLPQDLMDLTACLELL